MAHDAADQDLVSALADMLIELLQDVARDRHRNLLRHHLVCAIEQNLIDESNVWAFSFQAMGIEADYGRIVDLFQTPDFGLMERVALAERLNELVLITEVQHSVRGEGENEYQDGGTNASSLTFEGPDSMVSTVAAVAPRARAARAGSDEVVGQDRTGSITTKADSFVDHEVDISFLQSRTPPGTASMTTTSADLDDQADTA